MKHYGKFYIDGQWVDPVHSRTFELINPATEVPFASISLGSPEDVDRAVKAARKAFPSFSATSREERVALLERIALGLEARSDDFMCAVTQELGAPWTMRSHVQTTVESFRQAAATLRSYEFETPMGLDRVRREPIGVAGMITPWNWPIQSLANKVAPALAAGCTVVLKPSEFTSICAVLMAEVLHSAGVPKGVFNLVNGDGPVTGNAISTHPEIDMVSFTGSTRAGVLIAQAAANTVKRVCQELGGKSANVVLPDADLAAAARWNVARAFGNTGQSCHAPSRMLVQAEQVSQVLELLRAEVGRIVVGDPRDAATTMGPVVNSAQYHRIQGYIQTGIDEGAHLVCGGLGRPAGLERGYYVRPTVFASVTNSMRIAREEIFGPVLSVLPYSTPGEAVRIANDSPYGLGAYVFAKDLAKGREVGQQLRAGRVFYNGAASNPSLPMGGYKQSGNGREMGVFGLEEYLEVKAMIGFEVAVA